MTAKVFFLLPLMLTACMQASEQTEGGILSGAEFIVDGQTLVADQKTNWPQMIPQVDASGVTTEVQSGTADTVVVSGSPDSRDRAIKALALYCGRSIEPEGFDKQYVFKDPKTGDWWFDGFCG